MTDAIVAAAREVLGERLVAVLLAGSHASGGARPGSDVNALFVVRGSPAHAARRALGRRISRLALWGAEVRLTPQMLAEDDLDPADPALAQGVRLLWGGGPAVERFLSDLRDRYAFDAELGTWTWSPRS